MPVYEIFDYKTKLVKHMKTRVFYPSILKFKHQNDIELLTSPKVVKKSDIIKRYGEAIKRRR